MTKQSEYPNRRSLLFGGTGLAALLAIPSLTLPGMAVAKAPGDKRLIVILLRGGVDGLAMVPPYADPAYKDMRGNLVVREPLDLNGFFGLHPALRNLHQFYQQQQLAVFHAVASPYRARSHFDAQNVLELGVPTPHGRNDGWLNRALSLMGPNASSLGVAFAQSPPLILNGTIPVLSWVPGNRDIDPDFLGRLTHLYDQDPLFSQNLAQAIQASSDQDMASAPGNNRQNILSQQQTDALGRMLGPQSSHRVAVLDVGGWDTHANQGSDKGMLATRLEKLDEGLGRLGQSLAPVWADTAVLVMTEFGRTVAVNGTGGTDHGTGGMALLFGGAVNGGHILTKWPGLALEKLYQQRDLAPTLDVRAILKAVLIEHFGLSVSDINRIVFPESPDIQAITQLLRR